MGFRLTLTLCMHPCKSRKRSISMWGDKVICHPWQQLIFSSCFWHSGPIVPLPQTTANCAVFIAGFKSHLWSIISWPSAAQSSSVLACYPIPALLSVPDRWRVEHCTDSLAHCAPLANEGWHLEMCCSDTWALCARHWVIKDEGQPINCLPAILSASHVISEPVHVFAWALYSEV